MRTLLAPTGFLLAIPVAFVAPHFAYVPWVLWPVPALLVRLRNRRDQPPW